MSKSFLSQLLDLHRGVTVWECVGAQVHTHLPGRLGVVLGWHFEVVHAAVGALEGEEAAVFGSDLGVPTGATSFCKMKIPNVFLQSFFFF